MSQSLMQLVIALVLLGLVASDTAVPGAGYGCAVKSDWGCKANGEDEKCREYVLRAEIRSFTIKNSKTYYSAEEDLEFVTRTWSIYGGDVNSKSCVNIMGEYSNDLSILGPCLEVIPGGKVYIRLENAMDETNVTHQLVSSRKPNPQDFLNIVPLYKDMKDVPLYNKPAQNTSELGIPESVWKPGQEWNATVANKTGLSEATLENMPGTISGFNATNLHLHGLEVVPHLFHPMGTSQQGAPWIDVKPKSEAESPDQSCYSYIFEIPESHPTGGTYWYHSHRHGATMIQALSGMAGLIVVPGVQDDELRDQYNVTSDIPFVISDPHLQRTGDLLEVAPFLESAEAFNVTIPYLVNFEYHPTFDFVEGETARFRVLCAAAQGMCAFEFVPVPPVFLQGDDLCNSDALEPIQFENIGSDGNLRNESKTMSRLILSGGMREELVFRFGQPGRFAICQRGLQDKQFFHTGPPNATLAWINVHEPSLKKNPIVQEDLGHIILTPGHPEILKPEDIKKKKSLVFDMDGDQQKLPFPHFRINQNTYSVKDAPIEDMNWGDAEELIIMNYQFIAHPFHIHVNPFIVKEVQTTFQPGSTFTDYLTEEADGTHWRDTVIVPPKGFVRLWYIPKVPFSGMTVLHCHILGHEDEGMIANFRINASSNTTTNHITLPAESKTPRTVLIL